MRILVLGAGVVGITTAYELARKGCKVTVVDQACSVAAGASFANGGQLSYSFVDPLASPQMVASLPGILLGRNSAIRFNCPFDRQLMRWGIKLLGHSFAPFRTRDLKSAITLALESRAALNSLLGKHNISFRHRVAGKLVVTRSLRAFNAMRAKAEIKKRAGLNVYALSPSECHGLASGLDDQLPTIAGGIYSPDDAVGDARRFTEALAMICSSQYGVEIKLKRRIRGLLTDSDRAVGVTTSGGDFTADAVVVALGAGARPLLERYGIHAPIMPVKGYSFSMPASESMGLGLSLTDADKRIVFAPLDNEIRVAGLADFDGTDTSLKEDRLKLLKQTAQEALPFVGDYDHACSGWAGIRPMTPDGLPITGKSRMAGLYLNCGHGMFGWTFACGSADRLADLMLEKRRNNEKGVAA
ncbi:MAG: FAD-dependent oxidoreductase [Alphaproteobacteria bacterium]|nr:FAD-dependent oxidoreductase [Alphaproteobacteria bacterium]